MNTERALRLPNFIKRFGPLHGLRLGLGLPASGGDVSAPARAVAVPGFKGPIWLRPTRSDYSIFWQCIVRGQYDLGHFPQTAELLRRFEAIKAAGQTPVIIDGGANVGLSLRSFARDFPGAHIVSIEPDEQNMRVLAANAREAGDQATLVLGGIASNSGYCRVVARERGSAGFRTEECTAQDPDAIRAYSVDELLALVPGGVPWIVKLDIEGAQEELFSRNLDWIDRTDLIILEPDDWAFPWSGSTVNFFRALSHARFDYLIDGELILCFRHKAA
ncbi:MAG: FkbM family methyltransferase [Candidatus Andeanibacterium colombiense]|uniref:FkbM family methyltransferase n=1 Tax=Candidatus Andeanibacterium colombiense TaxID=3121345 RepID=A0AAJ5X8K4_9SPHN|nr:MAG: FkbM family methyltransferase [Sphingomonadaceae bacterium]